MSTPRKGLDLESYRIAKDLSWSQLSRATGISRETLRRNWNHPDEFKWGQFKKILRALSIPDSAVTAA